jgi:hypothetical protein
MALVAIQDARRAVAGGAKADAQPRSGMRRRDSNLFPMPRQELFAWDPQAG